MLQAGYNILKDTFEFQSGYDNFYIDTVGVNDDWSNISPAVSSIKFNYRMYNTYGAKTFTIDQLQSLQSVSTNKTNWFEVQIVNNPARLNITASVNSKLDIYSATLV